MGTAQSSGIQPGTVIDGREVIRRLGVGGMGAVYLTRHLTMDRQEALKIMHPRFVADPEFLKRFKREGQSVAALKHPNIVEIYAHGVFDSMPYLSMEYLDGDSLGGIVRTTGRLSPRLAVPLFQDICAGLQHAHDAGIIHRDLKPDNVMLVNRDDRRHAKVVDFGLAKACLEAQRLTLTGEVVGDPRYMSPEQTQGKQLDYRSDIYSLGCLMYEVLTGVPPFDADNHVALMYKRLQEEPPPFPEHIGVAPAYEEIVLRALAVDPKHRFKSAAHLAEELAYAMEDKYVSKPLAPSVFQAMHTASDSASANAPAATQVNREWVRKWRLPDAILVLLLVLFGTAVGINYLVYHQTNQTDQPKTSIQETNVPEKHSPPPSYQELRKRYLADQAQQQELKALCVSETSRQRVDLLLRYGDFVAEKLHRYDLAQSAYEEGGSRCGLFQQADLTTFLKRLAAIQHPAHVAHEDIASNPRYGMSALEQEHVSPESSASGAKTAIFIAESLADQEDFRDAQYYLDRAKAGYTHIRQRLPVTYFVTKMVCDGGLGDTEKLNDDFVEGYKYLKQSSPNDLPALVAAFYKVIQDHTEVGLWQQKILPLLQHKEFRQLDRMYEEADRDTVSMPDGTWRVDYFYDALCDLTANTSPPVWQTRKDLILKWLQSQNSDAARIALAGLLYRHAKIGLQTGSLSMEEINDDLSRARASLSLVKVHSKMWYLAALSDRHDPHFDAHYLECSQAFPHLYSAVCSRVAHDAEIEGTPSNQRFTKLADCEDSDTRYALTASLLDRTDPDLSQQLSLDKSRQRDGLQLVLRNHPECLTARAALSALCMRWGDFSTAERVFDSSPALHLVPGD